MGQLTDMINKFKSVRVNDSVRNALLETQNDYIGLVIDQMEHGLDSNGNPLGEYANDDYAFEKHAMNPKPGLSVMDFKYRGSFYQGIHIVVRGNSFSIFSIDSKAPKLEIIASEPIYLLTKKNKSYYVNNSFKTALIKQLKLFL